MAELKDVRYQEADCVKCGKTHKEWFHETVHHASRVFEKWAMWMASPLYECIEGYWRLNPSIARERIAELCQPLERQL